MKALHQKCLSLMGHILPSLKRPNNVEEITPDILLDAAHIRPRAMRCASRAFIKNDLDLPLTVKGILEEHPFVRQLRDAFRVDYQMPHITSLGNMPIEWFSQFGFTDP